MKALVIFVGLVVVVAAVGGRFGPDAWFVDLRKPSWNPPGWVFGPVWSVLYLGIAVAGWRFWCCRPKCPARTRALVAWGVQLVLNGLWSPLFFGLHRIDLALVDIVLLDLAVIATIALGWRCSRMGSLLLVPYLLWIGFATALNAAIWWMNR